MRWWRRDLKSVTSQANSGLENRSPIGHAIHRWTFPPASCRIPTRRKRPSPWSAPGDATRRNTTGFQAPSSDADGTRQSTEYRVLPRRYGGQFAHIRYKYARRRRRRRRRRRSSRLRHDNGRTIFPNRKRFPGLERYCLPPSRRAVKLACLTAGLEAPSDWRGRERRSTRVVH